MRQLKPKKGFLDGYKTYDTKGGYGNCSEWSAAWRGMPHGDAILKLNKSNPLDIMGFDVMPSKADLDKRYRELVMRHHPDRGGDAKEFIKVHAAWSLLRE